jgi:hypothetical protein
VGSQAGIYPPPPRGGWGATTHAFTPQHFQGKQLVFRKETAINSYLSISKPPNPLNKPPQQSVLFGSRNKLPFDANWWNLPWRMLHVFKKDCNGSL